ncbi:SET domain protein [Haematococcus lacustris]
MAQLATEVKDTLGALEHRWCPGTQQNSVFATRKVLAGTVISRFDAKEVTTVPTMYTVQTGENEHIVLQPTLLEYINHSCNPTAFFDTAERQLVALREIQPGDEVTFNYVSTEFDMATPFDCHCGEEGCFGRISGAAHVPQAQLEKCRLNAHISRMLAARDAKV